MIRVQEVDLESEMIGNIHNMRISPSRTVAELKIAIAAQLGVAHHDVRCVVERYYNTLKLLDVPTKTVHAEGFPKTNKVFTVFSVYSHTMSGCTQLTSMFYVWRCSEGRRCNDVTGQRPLHLPGLRR